MVLPTWGARNEGKDNLENGPKINNTGGIKLKAKRERNSEVKLSNSSAVYLFWVYIRILQELQL